MNILVRVGIAGPVPFQVTLIEMVLV